MKIFLDSSAFISLLASDQASHREAKRIYHQLKSKQARLYTSNYVLSESFTWLLYYELEDHIMN